MKLNQLPIAIALALSFSALNAQAGTPQRMHNHKPHQPPSFDKLLENLM